MNALGFGVDRVTMLMTNWQSIRDVVLFPLLRDRDQGGGGRITMPLEIISIDKLADLHNLLHGRNKLMWRGQGDSKWNLVPSIFRGDAVQNIQRIYPGKFRPSGENYPLELMST